MPVDPAQLAALESGAGFADRSDRGRLLMTGADALDLLNRLTTQKLEELPPGRAASTVLTNGDARVIDHLRLAAVEGGFWLLAGAGRAQDVADWIDLYTFAEDALAEDRSAATAQLTVAGPAAADALAGAGLPAPAPDAAAGSRSAVVVASPFGAGTAYDVVLPAGDAGAAREALLRAGAVEADADAFEARRIAQGVPAYGAEFGAFNNPLEARLLGSISDDKGCYTGQEVIARLQTYRKVQRLLMSFASDAPAAPGDALLDADGAPAGVVTSACAAGGRTIGLALVASRHAVAGAALHVAGGGDASLAHPPHALATEPVEA